MKTIFLSLADPEKKSGMFFLLLICIVTRIFTSIYYFADPDSIRFAMAVSDFDVTQLRPHFPGYPVFVFFSKIINLITGNFAVTFSIIGGIATFIIIKYLLHLRNFLNWKIDNFFLLYIVFFNPFLWIMSNRYMPDLAGLATGIMAIYFYITEKINPRNNWIFFFLCGILAGIRLSYLPFFILPVISSLITLPFKPKQILAGLIGILIWFIPFVVDTGIEELFKTAFTHSRGHFTDWGGTMETESSFSLRTISFLQAIAAYGIGGFWPDRNWFFLIVTFLFIILSATGILKNSGKTKRTSEEKIIFISLFIYVAWAFFFQNIIFSPRHLMPLFIFILLIAASGLTSLKKIPVIIISSFIIILTSSFFHLQDHQQPVAMTQVSEFIKMNAHETDVVVSTELVNFYLRSTGAGTRFHAVDNENLALDYSGSGRIFVVGNFKTDSNFTSAGTKIFYHNPYVNKIWAKVPVTIMKKNEKR